MKQNIKSFGSSRRYSIKYVMSEAKLNRSYEITRMIMIQVVGQDEGVYRCTQHQRLCLSLTSWVSPTTRAFRAAHLGKSEVKIPDINCRLSVPGGAMLDA